MAQPTNSYLPATRPTPPGAGRRRGAGPQAYYDGVTGSQYGVGSGNKRRRAVIELGEEEERLLRPVDRLRAIGLLRDSLRNFPGARSMNKQHRVNVVGSLGKLICMADPDGWGKEVQTWFNDDWAREAEFRSGMHWGELLQLSISEITQSGDMVLAFDDGTITGGDGTGKILTFESDQIADVNLSALREQLGEPKITQLAGVIKDGYGREMGITVCADKRGRTEIPIGEAFVLTRDLDQKDFQPNTPAVKKPGKNDCWWRHVKRQFRLIQARGIGEALTGLPFIVDGHEILGKELQSAKLAASLAMKVKRSDAVDDLDDPRLDPDAPQSTANADGEAVTPPDDLPENWNPAADEPKRYEAFEALTGGYIEYMDRDDEIEALDLDRPNVKIKEFLGYTTDMAGASQGLAHAYSTLHADGSYTAFRGDMILTWVCVRDNQTFMEREICTWGAIQAIRWGIHTKKIPQPPATAKGWEHMLVWQWPKMPEVHEVEAQNALSLRLKNGATTYAEELGPTWREKFSQLAVEIAEAKRLGLPLAMFETKSGGAAAEQAPAAEGNG